MFGKPVMGRSRSTSIWIAFTDMMVGVGFVAGLGLSAYWTASAREPDARLTTLIASGQTVTGETISYPAGAPAKITAVILTLQPGEDTGLHRHGVPTFGYVLEGEVTVAYEGQISRVYKAGDAILEAMTVAHNGRNSGAGPMRILAVFMGAEGMAVSEKVVHQ